MQPNELSAKRQWIPLILLIFGIGLFEAACSTYYGPTSFWQGGGYEDAQLSPDTWKINYHLNEEGDRTYDLALVRAAWLCKQNGYPWFKINTSHQQTVPHIYSSPTAEYQPILDEFTWEQSIWSHNSTSSSIIVTGSKFKVPGALNSDYVLSSLSRKYRISEDDLRQ
jgi:hypothetical protein